MVFYQSQTKIQEVFSILVNCFKILYIQLVLN